MTVQNFAPKQHRYSLEEVRDALNANAKSVLQHLFPAGRIISGEFCIGDITGTKGKSLRFNLDKCEGKDFAAGTTFGDMLDVWKEAKGLDWPEAIQTAAEYMGIKASNVSSTAPADEEDEDLYIPRRDGKMVGKWVYHDAAGNEWGIEYRFDNPHEPGKKDHTPWDCAKQIWKMPEGPRPLYRLPELLKDTSPVIVTEGPKKAQALSELGFNATSPIGGSNAPAKSDWDIFKGGRSAIIWPDNDEAGAKFAENVKNLITKIGGRVEVLAPPKDKPSKWDAYDAIHHDKWSADKVKEFLSTHMETPGINILNWHVGKAYLGEPAKRKWLVQDLFPQGKAMLYAAPGGAGKSFKMLELAYMVACGQTYKDFLGHTVSQKGAAVIFTAEDDQEEVHHRLKSIDPDGRYESGKIPLYVIPLPSLDGPLTIARKGPEGVEATQAWRDICNAIAYISDIKMVVFDPLQTFISIDSNDASEGQFVCGLLGWLATNTGATVIATHHMSKRKEYTSPAEARDAIRGSTSWVDGLRLSYAMWPVPGRKNAEILKKLGRKPIPGIVFNGAVVKCNGPSDLSVRTLIRNMDTGILEDMTQKVKEIYNAKDADISEPLIEAIKKAAAEGNPFTKTKTSGIYTRKKELPGYMHGLGRDQLQDAVQQLIDAGQIVKCAIDGGQAMWLDVPGGALHLNQN
ncbi:MAG: hypothetical protein CMF62_06275 [Magnetococcales bacterium]|nr:hypothetical protein [Magnetococcales bacterium]|tara:strand:+ start:289730 stop:291781 length:2052 start_codon:yes stop_codon:yes gene_type:complete